MQLSRAVDSVYYALVLSSAPMYYFAGGDDGTKVPTRHTGLIEKIVMSKGSNLEGKQLSPCVVK